MTTRPEDEGIRAVRNVRKKISAEFANDPKRIVAHYIAEQERHRERLLRPVASHADDTAQPIPPRSAAPTN